MVKFVEGLYQSLPRYLTPDVEVGDVFVADDGSAVMVVAIKDDRFTFRDVDERELAELRRRRYSPV